MLEYVLRDHRPGVVRQRGRETLIRNKVFGEMFAMIDQDR
jgi:hypothetical protein